MSEIPQISAAGRTSVALDATFDPALYSLSGFRILGKKAVRVDILERLADLIRPALAWRQGGDAPRPEGGYENNAFLVTPAMMSILGATHEDMNEILTTLGYTADVKPAEAVEMRLGEIAPNCVPPSQTADKANSAPTDAAKLAEEKPQDDSKETNSSVAKPPQEEEKLISVWRPARLNRSGKNDQRRRGPRNEAGSNKDGRKNAKSQGARNDEKNPKKKPAGTRNPRHRTVEPDPDSPFAKLAALKAALEKNNG